MGQLVQPEKKCIRAEIICTPNHDERTIRLDTIIFYDVIEISSKELSVFFRNLKSKYSNLCPKKRTHAPLFCPFELV